MPTGPKGQKRRGDVLGNAIKVARIATGEEEEEFIEAAATKNEAAAELGHKGGAALAAKMAPERRAEIARCAANARWTSKTERGD